MYISNRYRRSMGSNSISIVFLTDECIYIYMSLKIETGAVLTICKIRICECEYGIGTENRIKFIFVCKILKRHTQSDKNTSSD